VSDLGPLHMIYPYAGAAQYLDGALAYVQAARAVGAAVVIAAPSEHRSALAERLGDAEAVEFLDTAVLGRNPARLLGAWQAHIDRHADGRAVHGINDTALAGADERYSGEARYTEWLLNRAFTGAGAWSLLCPIDTDAHPAPQVQALARCHPLVWNGTAHTPAADYLTGPYALDELPDPPPDAQHLSYRLDNLGHLRATVAAFARRHALPAERTSDLILVTSELATNSIRHGGGGGSVHLWRESDALACEFRDHGVISDPLAGRLRPSAKQLGGRGLWFVNQLCDLVQLRSEPARGTRVRIWIELAGR
jgi:anti-sigma regulatory factor (Ser/Thr protein kinase)